MRKFLKKFNNSVSRNATILFLLLGFYLLLLKKFSNGIGQYWDWSFPFFKNDVHNFFDNDALSWTAKGLGQPLSYSSDYFFRLILSHVNFIEPEFTLYFLIATLLSLISFVAFLIMKKYTSVFWALFFALLCVLNPLIFYKLDAGHIDYLVSLLVFEVLVLFTLFYFQKNFSSILTLSFLFALVGAQIQFFIFSFAFLIIFFAFNKNKFSLLILVCLPVVSILINLPWLVNFILGAANLSEISSNANKVSFASLRKSNLSDVFALSFSRATLIERYFSPLILYFTYGVYVIAFYTAIRTKLQKNQIMILSLITFFILLSTGIYQLLDIKPLNIFYPMLREVGHFAPLIMLFLCIFFAMGKIHDKRALFKVILIVILLPTMAYSGYKIASNQIDLSFSTIRQQFSSFRDFRNSHPEGRVLTYPFFDQYSFTDTKVKRNNNLPLNNSGHDSFDTFSVTNYINNAISPSQFDDSIQYQLLKTKDIDVLRGYGVKYLFDYSNIYESNFNNYVSQDVYKNNLSLIKNNKDFFDDLLRVNPDKLTRISKDILEVKVAEPKFSSLNSIYRTDVSDTDQYALSKFTNSVNGESADYTSNELKTTNGSNKYVKTLYSKASEYGSQTILDKNIKPNKSYTLYENNDRASFYYVRSNNRLDIFQSSNLEVIGASNSNENKLVASIEIKTNSDYYFSLNNEIVHTANGRHSLGIINSSTEMRVLETNKNNYVGSVTKDKKWTNSLRNCTGNTNPLNASATIINEPENGGEGIGIQSRQAGLCVSKSVGLTKSDNYIFQISYRSNGSSSARYGITLGSNTSSYIQSTVKNNWGHSNELINANDVSQASINLYSTQNTNPGSNTMVNNYYDDIGLYKVLSIQKIDFVTREGKFSKLLDAKFGQLYNYKDSFYDNKNLIDNSSFTDMLWSNKVNDCNNYDLNPELGQSRVSNYMSKDGNSLLLTALKHTACTSISVSVKGGGLYKFAFDYRLSKASTAGYAIEFNDPLKSQKSQKYAYESGGWSNASNLIDIPENATTAQIYLYSYEIDGSIENSAYYDNVFITRVPDLRNKYFLLEAGDALEEKTINYVQKDSTKYTIDLKNLRGPQYIKMLEKYNSKWTIRLANSSNMVASQIEHFEINDGFNGWYVNPTVLCKANLNTCPKNFDGSYDLRFIVEFAPQKYFKTGLIVSGVTSVCCAIYISYRLHRKYNVYRTQKKL